MEPVSGHTHTHCVELRVIGEEPGKVRMGLICTSPGCSHVEDSRWWPAPMGCLALMLARRAQKKFTRVLAS